MQECCVFFHCQTFRVGLKLLDKVIEYHENLKQKNIYIIYFLHYKLTISQKYTKSFYKEKSAKVKKRFSKAY